MPIDAATGALLTLGLALAASGLLMGFLSGLFGIGGGGIVVPVLYELFRLTGVDEAVRMHMAVGTSLAIMIPTSLRSAMAHRAKGSLDGSVVSRLALPVVAGVGVGILIARSAPAELFKVVWVLFAAAMSAKLIFGKDSWRLGERLPAGRAVEGYGVVVGLLSTLLSIGGGAFITMLLTLYGRPIREAVGTSAAFGPIIAVPAMLGFMWAGAGNALLPADAVGYVSLLGAALVIPTSVLAAPYGVKAAHGIPRRALELAFACFLLLVGGRFLVSLIA